MSSERSCGSGFLNSQTLRRIRTVEIQKCRTHMTRTNLGKKTQTQCTVMSLNCTQNTSSHAHFSESCQSSQRSTSRATSALPVNLSQQLQRSRSIFPSTLGRSRSTFAGTLGAPNQPRRHPRPSRSTSPRTSALPVNLHLQLRRSLSTFASNSGAPSPATSALLVNPRPQLSARG